MRKILISVAGIAGLCQQGAASAFEDAIILSELLANFPVKKALALYQRICAERVGWVVKSSDDPIKTFVKTNSLLAAMVRNFFIKRKGPLNVLGWKQLFSICPLDNLTNLIKFTASEKTL